jgi:hypothetical protein
MRVDLIQFLRPNGNTRAAWCEVSDELKPQYEALRENGCRITCEELSDGNVSIAIEHAKGDFDIELCANKPHDPKAALERLIGRFDQAKFDKWEAEAA